jgi:osmotically-inducible protein OsmY
MKTDTQLQKDVRAALKWEPSVAAIEIGVAVSDGVVTLGGTVPSFAEKYAAREAVLQVAGVKAVTDYLQIEPFGPRRRDDAEIAQEATRALRSHLWLLAGVRATVKRGWVTLRGEVSWQFQRRAAENEVRHLPGVVGLSNEIAVKATAVLEEHAFGHPSTTAGTHGGRR